MTTSDDGLRPSLLLLDDADVHRLLDPATAIAAVRESLVAHHAGVLTAQPRLRAALGRDVARRQAFARRARSELGLPATTVPSPQTAVAGADIVVLATSSTTPVIEADWAA